MKLDTTLLRCPACKAPLGPEAIHYRQLARCKYCRSWVIVQSEQEKENERLSREIRRYYFSEEESE